MALLADVPCNNRDGIFLSGAVSSLLGRGAAMGECPFFLGEVFAMGLAAIASARSMRNGLVVVVVVIVTSLGGILKSCCCGPRALV